MVAHTAAAAAAVTSERPAAEPYYRDEHVTLLAGDCLDVLPTLPDASVDSIVTDPPYGLEFMGAQWDSFRERHLLGAGPQGDAWRDTHGITRTGYGDAERLPRPSFGGGDTANPTCSTCGGRRRGTHRCECEAPEWRVKGEPMGAGGTGAQMRAFGAWCNLWAVECLRILKPGGYLIAFGGSRTWHRLTAGIEDAGFEVRDSIAWLYGSGFPKSLDVARAVDKVMGAAGEWRREDHPGRAGDRGNNGAIINQTDHRSPDNPDGLRHVYEPSSPEGQQWQGWATALKPAFEPIVIARKPLPGTVAANVLRYGTGALNVDACRVPHRDAADLAESTGKNQHARFGSTPGAKNVYGDYATVRDYDGAGGRWPPNVVLDDEIAAELGAESRFFPIFRYEPKAPAHERPSVDGVAHPTVKPLDLTRWLVQLVTRPGGVVLDLFAGSGTTGEACIVEGFDCILIERHLPYLPLIVERLSKPIGRVLL